MFHVSHLFTYRSIKHLAIRILSLLAVHKSSGDFVPKVPLIVEKQKKRLRQASSLIKKYLTSMDLKNICSQVVKHFRLPAFIYEIIQNVRCTVYKLEPYEN